MFNRMKSAMNNVIGNIGSIAGDTEAASRRVRREIRHPYGRPDFLKLNEDEVQVSADHTSRPILVPRDISRLPWSVGYAEVINAGKTKSNEDQARAGLFYVKNPTDDGSEGPEVLTNLSYFKKKLRGVDLPFDIELLEKDPLPFMYFAIFDGHAGTGAALMAVNTLHNIIQERLCDVRDLLLIKRYGLDELENKNSSSPPVMGTLDKSDLVTEESLVVGSLESSFFEMDDLIGKERLGYQISGGCTALVAMFFMGKLYVANAGDCRAILVRGDSTLITMSQDFTPVTERQRIQVLGEQHPQLMNDDFTHLEFIRRVTRRDLGKQLLCRDGKMKGWAYKTVSEDDLKFPLIYGDGKRARVLATIGVTRGFGDHDLKVYDTDIYIKPFLTPMPDVRIYDMAGYEHSENDILIMGSDGLWDVLSNAKAAEIVRKSLKDFEGSDPARYTSAAQELVLNARGLLKKSWKTTDNKQGSGDDITAFVIPLHHYSAGPSQSSSTESALDAKLSQAEASSSGSATATEANMEGATAKSDHNSNDVADNTDATKTENEVQEENVLENDNEAAAPSLGTTL